MVKSLNRTATASLLPFATALLALAIFVVDTITDLEIAVPVFYVVVVLMSVRFCSTRGVFLVSAGCMGLTIVSFFLTTAGASDAGLINSSISIAAIGVTTYLAVKIESARAAASEARAQLAHVSRLTTLGELTASIAHEVNQPLAAVVINGNACLHWLASDPPDLGEARQAVERIVEDANHATGVVRRVRGLAKGAAPRKDVLSINEVILETLALTLGEAREARIAVRTQLADDLPAVRGDRVQLQQVVLNLVVNAIEALSAVDEGTRELTIRSFKDAARGVVVTVADSGIGFHEGSPDRAFDALYTTKAEGLGMGLAICRSIIEAHGGRVRAAQNAPKGAIVEFSLPAGRGHPPTLQAAQ